MRVLTGLSISLFLFLPYYYGLLTNSRKIIYNHFAVWITLNSILSVIFSSIQHTAYTAPFILLIVGTMYFVLSYMCSGRKLQDTIDKEHRNHRTLISDFRFDIIFKLVLTIAVITALIDIYMILTRQENIYSKVYFIIMIVTSCAQMFFYRKVILGLAKRQSS